MTQHQDGEGEEKKEDASSVSLPNDNQPCYTFGLIADIQYAPIEDGFSFTGTPRYYRHALQVAHEAFQDFQSSRVDFAINLGDTIDGKCVTEADDDPEQEDALGHVLEALKTYTHGPIWHSYGNHCLYNLDRPTLQQRLGIPFREEEPHGEWVGYYDFCHQSTRFVVLDGYDIALMQRCPDTSLKHKQAREILQTQNPNMNEGNPNSPKGLEDLERRFVAFNGGVGQEQLKWLRNTLQDARELGQHVIVLSHNPIHPESSNPVCLIWNFQEVLDILRLYNDVVVASFSGHAHKGGYCRDEESGIHFRVVEAALENRPEKTYAMVDVYTDSRTNKSDDDSKRSASSPRLVLRGFGNCVSAVYDFEHTKTAVLNEC